MTYATWAMVSFGMFTRFQALIRQQVEGLRDRPPLKGGWYVLFVALICVEAGLLAHVGLAVSNLFDRLSADKSELLAGGSVGRHVLQLTICLVSIIIGFILMAATGRLISCLRDSRNKRARRADQQTSL